jgi:KDO2-lipid IV(A) lauroyltransferase
MQAVIFYLTLPFLYLISLLPFPLLYLLSDFLFVIVYCGIGYRIKVVTENLRNSFPEKSENEIFEIRRKFYRYLCDLFLETFKTMTIGKKSMVRRCRFNDESLKLFEKYYNEKRSVIVVMGHLGNWEWAGNTFSLCCRSQLYVIYHPLGNKYFNNLIISMRTRFGTKLIEMKETFRHMLVYQKTTSATAFIADQTPSPENAYWTTFLNQHTPVFWGTEKIAQRLNYPVIFASIRRWKRGYYEIFAETLFENPAQTKEGEVSQGHTKRLEEDIIKQPEIWLWSHRRWKHKCPS